MQQLSTSTQKLTIGTVAYTFMLCSNNLSINSCIDTQYQNDVFTSKQKIEAVVVEVLKNT